MLLSLVLLIIYFTHKNISILRDTVSDFVHFTSVNAGRCSRQKGRSYSTLYISYNLPSVYRVKLSVTFSLPLQSNLRYLGLNVAFCIY